MEAIECTKDLEWVLSTGFGRMVFIMVFLTWGLIMVNLVLGALIMVHSLFGRIGARLSGKKK